MTETADRRNIQGLYYWEHTILEINVIIIVTLRRVIHLVNINLDSTGYIHEIENQNIFIYPSTRAQ